MIHSIKHTKVFMSFTLIFVLLLVSVSITSAEPSGTTINVDTFDDELNADGDCSLREAIQAANSDTAVSGCPAGSGVDTINIPPGIYTISISGADENNNATGDFDILESVIILGGGVSNTIINGGDQDRVFHIIAATGSTVNVSMDNLTIENGYVSTTGAGGGGVLVQGSRSFLDLEYCMIRDHQTPNAVGGGLDAYRGTIWVTNCTIRDNFAKQGGGIYNDGNLDVYQSLITANIATVDGGGLDNGGSGETNLVNVTISGNIAPTGSGIFSDSTMMLTNVTIVRNSGTGSGFANNGIATLKNVIVAYHGTGTPVNCSGSEVSFKSGGHNLENGDTCYFNKSGDQINTDPLLYDNLQDNGGPTHTYALKPGSPAVDAGDNSSCPGIDQRGFPRPIDGNNDGNAVCDIGSYETEAFDMIFLPLVYR